MRSHSPNPRTLALALVAASAVAFAGCLTPQTTAGLDQNLGSAGGEAFAAVAHLPGGLAASALGDVPAALAVWRDVGHEAIEPTLGVTSTGALFLAAAYFDDGGFPVTDVLRSRDGGLTWEDVTPRVAGERVPPQTGDPYIYVDPATDRVFNFDMHPALACAFLSFSDDEGESWTSQPAACGTPPPYDHQTLVAGAPRVSTTVGYPSVVYQCVNRVSDSICARSLDGGLTWSPGTPVFLGVDPALLGPATATELEGFCGGLHGHAATAPDGTVYLPRAFCGRAFVGVSEDDGLTWRTVQVSDVAASEGPDPTLAVDAAGNAYYLFVDEAGLLRMSVSTDAGRSWSEAVVVSAPAVTAAHLPSVAAGDVGRIAFVYTGTENLPDGYLNAEIGMPADERPEDGDVNRATWNAYLAVVANALDPSPLIQTVRANDPADPLVRGDCGPGRCPGMYDFIDVVVAPDGRPYAAFVDACTGECATDAGTHEDSRGAAMSFAAAVATLAEGPALRGAAPAADAP